VPTTAVVPAGWLYTPDEFLGMVSPFWKGGSMIYRLGQVLELIAIALSWLGYGLSVYVAFFSKTPEYFAGFVFAIVTLLVTTIIRLIRYVLIGPIRWG
jgi:hypothetical protein